MAPSPVRMCALVIEPTAVLAFRSSRANRVSLGWASALPIPHVRRIELSKDKAGFIGAQYRMIGPAVNQAEGPSPLHPLPSTGREFPDPISRIEPLNQRRTFNTQHSTLNAEGIWIFEVEC